MLRSTGGSRGTDRQRRLNPSRPTRCLSTVHADWTATWPPAGTPPTSPQCAPPARSSHTRLAKSNATRFLSSTASAVMAKVDASGRLLHALLPGLYARTCCGVDERFVVSVPELRTQEVPVHAEAPFMPDRGSFRHSPVAAEKATSPPTRRRGSPESLRLAGSKPLPMRSSVPVHATGASIRGSLDGAPIDRQRSAFGS